MVREFAENEVAPIAGEIDENHRFSHGDLGQDRRARAPRHPVLPRTWAVPNGGHPGLRPSPWRRSAASAVDGSDPGGARQPGDLPDLRLGRRELTARSTCPSLIAWRLHGRLRPDRTQRGLGLGRYADDGGARRGRVRAERAQVLHARTPTTQGWFICHGGDRQVAGPKGISAFVVPRDIPGSRSRRARSSWACAARTGPAWSSRTRASRATTCSAPRARASRPS